MSRKKRVFIIILTAVFLTVATFSLFFTCYESEHKCISENCCICAVLSGCSELRRHLNMGSGASQCAFAPILFAGVVLLLFAGENAVITPVKLKVKLLN